MAERAITKRLSLYKYQRIRNIHFRKNRQKICDATGLSRLFIKKNFKNYREIYEDFGWSYINSPWLSGTRYWQKEDDDQNEIFSDRQSKSSYYKRLMSYSSCFGLLCLFYSYLIYKDSGLYLAEGLWSMEGAMFWKAFLFETPFALLRSLPALMAVIFGISYYKAYRKYSMLKEQ